MSEWARRFVEPAPQMVDVTPPPLARWSEKRAAFVTIRRDGYLRETRRFAAYAIAFYVVTLNDALFGYALALVALCGGMALLLLTRARQDDLELEVLAEAADLAGCEAEW